MIVFIILHYKSIEETIKCLECLKKTFKEIEYQTIVVDNNSLNDAEVLRIRKYTNDIILLKENMGFAKANNKGSKYALKKYNPDFMVVINNDVFITQKDFLEIVKKDFKKYHFDMLGPHINSTTGESCNPFPLLNRENLDEQIKYTKKLIKIYNSSILTFALNIYIRIKHLVKKPIIPTNGLNIEKNVGLHGCAIIFSKKYFKRYKDLFYNNTFLFYEEEFLYNRIIKDKLISLYDPNLKVFHKEGSSFKSNKSIRKSKLFKEREKLKSLNLLKKCISKDCF